MRSIPAGLEALAFALACAGALTLAAPLGCTRPLPGPQPAGEQGANPRRGGTLRLASGLDIRNLDPAGPTDGLAMQALLLMFDGLVDFDREGRVIPNLADSWEIGDDGRTYRFHLRPGVRMHDGAELTADDVKRSVERALHPTTPSPTASFFEGIVGYADYASGIAAHLPGVAAEGRYGVTFRLTQTDGAFLALLALPSMRPVCASGGERYLDSWTPCGAGPFKLDAAGWQRGTSLRVIRHDAYFQAGLPHLDAVEWTFNTGALPQRFRFEDGDLDLLLNPTQADVGRFAADPRWEGLHATLADNTSWGEAMNNRMAPFDNVEVRRAVAAAVDRSVLPLINRVNISPLTQLLPRGVPGYDPSFEGQRYDPAAALEHMRRAGYPYDPATGRGGWPRPIVYTVTDPSFESFWAQVLAQQLSRIGLRLQLRLVTLPAFYALTQRQGASAMHPQGNQADYADPSAFFDLLFTSSAITAEGTSNTARYSNPRYDEVVARARHSLDAGLRRALYHEADAILCDDAPWAFTHGQHDYVMRQPYVRGFEPHPIWPLDVRGVWLDRPGAAVPAASAGLR